jgi:hypothetical protein
MAFETEFASPIRAGGYLTATRLQVEIANQTATTLQRIVRPYILRRKKDDMQDVIQLPKKTEQILFCKLSPRQDAIYDSVLGSDEVRAVLQRRMTAFRSIMTLRKLCNHPDLVFRGNQIMWHRHDNPGNRQIMADTSHKTSAGLKRARESEPELVDSDVEDEDNGLDSSLWSDSGKLLVLSKILPLWHKQGHKVLIFSQMKGMLNLVEVMLKEFQFSYLRLDGSTSIGKRASIIDKFNQDDQVFIMLLTTRTGGLGISLTAADRVLILCPDWNPMTDIQARERSWRLGQQREVTIYRLISRGTIEEKIYQRQIFKILLSKRILEDPKQKALFSKSELKELFERTDESRSTSAAWAANASASGVDNDLPLEGEVMLRDSFTANEEYAQHVRRERGFDEDVEEGEEDDGVEGGGVQAMLADQSDQLGIVDEAKMTLEDRDIVLAYRQQAISKDDDEVDEDEDYSIVEMKSSSTSATKRSTAASARKGRESRSSKQQDKASLEIAQDKRLLESLFNGDAITGVYDHNYLEGMSSSSTSSARRQSNAIEDVAARSVQEAMRRVEASGSSNAHRSTIGSNSSSQLVSANLLASIQQRQQGSSSLSSSASNPSLLPNPSQSITQLIDTRLRQLFASNPNGMTSEVLLAYFPDLGDHHAVLFKQLLKSMAQMTNGMWQLK